MSGLPTGVEVRNGKIRISFIYRGIRCREVLQGWAVTTSNLRKAGNLRSLILSEIQLGRFNYASHFPESRALKKFTSTRIIKTFRELCDIFLAAKTIEISAASYYGMESRISTLLQVVGGDTRIADIQHSDLLRYRNELLTGDVLNAKSPWLNKQGRAVSTVNGLMNSLIAMLKLAFRSQYIQIPPYEGIKMLKRSRKDPDPLLQGEYDAFMSQLSRPAALIWTFAVFTGLRHGELCALAWEDVDLERGEIHICRNATNAGLFVPPKTVAGERTVTLLQPALDALREQFQHTGALGRQDIVFHHREHGYTEQQSVRFVFVPSARSSKKAGYYAKSSLAYTWNRYIAKAGVRARRPYQSRHTYACWMLTAGANPSFIASQMGHENAKMVYEVYSKWIGEKNHNQVDLLNQHLLTAMPPSDPGVKITFIKSS